jgi:hypothetical protein
MITIACTNCKTVLTMDEAFAGGVCRCQHCGTIQTVPSHLKHGAAAGTPAGQAVGASKSLYQQTRAHTDAASGLEALGDAVTSSGLGSGRLKAPPRVNPPAGASIDRAPAEPRAKNPLLVPLVIAVGVLVLLVIGLIIFMVTRSSPSNSQGAGGNGTDNSGSTEAPIAAVSGPSFLGAPIKGSTVVYLIDRGNATQDYFDGLKAALLQSLHSLGAGHSFQVVLWDNGDTPVSVPATNVIEANDQNIQQVQDALRDVVASGQSSMGAQLANAIKIKPDAIVIATAKAELSDDDAAALKKAASAGVPLYLFSLGSADLSATMLPAAGDSGGSFHIISKSQLDQLVQ